MSCEIQNRPGSVLVQKSFERISALDAFYEKDGREDRYIGEVLERYRGEDAGDLRRVELVEKWTCLNVLEKDFFNSDPKILTEEKSWRTWKSNQNVVMDEELVQNIKMDEELVQNVVMDEELMKNFVTGAKIDPKVEMGLSRSKIGVWNILQLSNRKLLEEIIEEAVQRLTGILSRDSFFLMQYLEHPSLCGNPKVKESKWQSRMLTLLCDDFCESLVTLQRQHFAASHVLHGNPRGPSSWRESTRMKVFMNIQMEYSKMRSEPSEWLSRFTWRTSLENMPRKFGREI